MDEEETCRICRSGAEEDAPLYHPCRCSGSIAMVHQDCLIEWLQHSQKKSCELCNTELRFHKIYSDTMPSKLPAYLYARRFLFLALQYLRFSLRAMFVATAWLALLPLGNIYIWRLHFWIVDVLVWGIIGGTPPTGRSSLSNGTNGTSAHDFALQNRTVRLGELPTSIKMGDNSTLIFGGNATTPLPLIPFERVAVRLIYGINYRSVFDSVAHDTFEGQILTCVIVVVFVAIFLLREWCMQNLPQQIQPMMEFGEGRFENRPAAIANANVNVRDPIVPREAADDAELRQGNDALAGQDVRPVVDTMPTASADLEEQERLPAGESDGRADTVEAGANGNAEDWSSDAIPEDVRRKRLQFLSRVHEVNDHLDAPSGSIPRANGHAAIGEATPAQDGDKGKAKEMNDDAHPDSRSEDDEATPTQEKGKGKEQESLFENGSRHEHDAQEENEGSPMSTGSSGEHVASPISPTDEHHLADETASESTDSAHVEEDAADDTLDVAAEAVVAADNLDVMADGAADERGVDAADPALDLQDWENDPLENERIEDDIEGMMEAIGMRGPLINLFTNITLMFVLCSFTLTVSVALPYMMGRLAGARSILPRVAMGPTGAFSGTVQKLANALASDKSRLAFMGRASAAAKETIIRHLTRAYRFTPITVISTRVQHLSAPASDLLGRLTQFAASSQTLTAFSGSMRTMLNSFSANVSSLLDRAALMVASLEEKTRGSSSHDKAFCIALGHSFWLMGLAIQSALSHVFVRWNLRSLKTFVDQQIVVLKVLSFIVIELFVFPLCCGILFDFALFPLWDGATITGRLALTWRYPLTMAFTVWSVGTLYMFLLSLFVGHMRSVVRPGLLCFVRDPSDPTFHPIKDILERRSVEQLRKIGLSGLIYSFILTITFGVCSRAVALCAPGILPLRWNVHQPISSSALELVCIAAILPIAVGTWLPAHWARKSTRFWWRKIASSLRMSEYLTGERRKEEEGRQQFATWMSLFAYCIGRPAETTLIKDGSSARVPSTDIAVMSAPLIIRTNERGEPLNDRGWDALHVQREAVKKMQKKPQYVLVYLPSHYRVRITIAVAALWASVCLQSIGVLVGPLLLGRTLVSYFASPNSVKVHDGIAWTVGFSAASLGWSLANKTRRMYRRLCVSTNAPRRFYKHASRFLQRVWLITSLCGLLGALTGITLELYFNALISAIRSAPALPDISLLHTTALGIMSQYLFISIVPLFRGRAIPAEPLSMPLLLRPYFAWRVLRDGGWRRPPTWRLTTQVVAPISAILAAAIAAPLATLGAVRHTARALSHPSSLGAAEIPLTFALYAGAFLFYVSHDAMLRRIEAWTDDIKDEHFLISTELRNYASPDNEQNGDAVQAEDGAPGDGADGVVVDGPIPDVLLHAAH